MAKLTIAPSPHAAPAYRLPADPVSKVSRTFWWPLAALIVLIALFDPLRALGDDITDDLHAVLPVAAGVGLLLGLNLVVGHNRPMRLGTFDVLVFLLLFYMTASVAATMIAGAGGGDALLRFLRLATQVCLFYVVVSTCIGRPALRARCLRLVWWIVLATCAFALLQIVGQETGTFNLFFEYQSLRTYGALWQATAQFAEPALLGQFMVAALFIFFSDIDNIRRHWPSFGMIAGTIGLTQSVGALFGLIAWALFLFAYNYRSLLSLRRLDTKLMLLLLACVAVAAFSLISRVSMVDLATLDLPNSGQKRVTSEFAAVAELVGRDWTEGFLFGVGESMTETIRGTLGAGRGGNALVELLLRYGLTAIVLLWLVFNCVDGFLKGLMLFAIFTLLGQIDGAVAKPYIWLYTALIAVALTGPRPIPQAVPINQRMSSTIAPNKSGVPQRSDNPRRRPGPQAIASVQEIGEPHSRAP